MTQHNEATILLAFYGDDFTGTTAIAETLTETGVPTVIFTEPPTPSFLAEHFSKVKAVGLAGVARTLPVAEMEGALRPIFESLKAYRAPVVLYKVCSTFDSSRKVGNIGRAIELGREIFRPDFVPVLPAAPQFGRFTVFGHHFAALGQAGVYRLDRHPSMANHPVTPMKESDLRLHLTQQTPLKSELITVLDLDEGKDHAQALLNKFISESTPIVFFDCLYEAHLMTACEAIWQRAGRDNPVFVVGSQELGYGLGRVWQKAGLIPANRTDVEDESTSAKGPLFVISGSCATVTGNQISWAIENGFAGVEIQPHKLLDPAVRPLEQERIIKAALSALQQGRSMIAHTAMGPDDIRIDLMNQRATELSLTNEKANAILGDALGAITLAVLQQSALKRVVVAGGDTSGRIQKYLAIQALQVATSVGTAAPLCYVYSRAPRSNGLEIAFKGGQVGTVDYFGQVQHAHTLDFEAAALGRF